MSKPVIVDVQVDKPILASGEETAIRVNATDPDSRDVTVEINVNDPAGENTQFRVLFPIHPLSYSAVLVSGDPADGSIRQDPTDSTVFYYTAP
jgi:hypothetical protein